MSKSFTFRDIDEALPYLANEVLAGPVIGSRAGETAEILFPHIVLNEPWRREVLNPERHASLPAQIAETMWVLAGRDDIEWLGHYLPRASNFSDDGVTWRGAYGKRLRAWRKDFFKEGTDQLAFVVELLRQDPETRRAIMSIYDPSLDSKDGKDIPCNNWLHFLVRDGKLHLHVVIRSNDLMWGWSGINAFEWSVLQEVIAGLVGLPIGELHFSISSLHLYANHWEKARRIGDTYYAENTVDNHTLIESPSYQGFGWEVARFDAATDKWFFVEKEIREGQRTLGDVLSLIDAFEDIFEEPMMTSWLYVIAWHWTKDEKFLAPLNGTRLQAAALLSPRHDVKRPEPVKDSFTEFVVALHSEKHAVYGDSWKRRGEQIGIMANIARKVDRLGVAGAGDTAADTVIDLLCYLAKYRLWLTEFLGASIPEGVGTFPLNTFTDNSAPANYLIEHLPKISVSTAEGVEPLIGALKRDFDELEWVVREGGDPHKKAELVDLMLKTTVPAARFLWRMEQDLKAL